MLYKARLSVLLLHRALFLCAPVCPVPVAAVKSYFLFTSGGNIGDSPGQGPHSHPHQLTSHSTPSRISGSSILHSLLVMYQAEHGASIKTSAVVKRASDIRDFPVADVKPGVLLAAMWSAMFCPSLEDMFLPCQEKKLVKTLISLNECNTQGNKTQPFHRECSWRSVSISKRKGKATDTFWAESLCYIQVCHAFVWSSSKILLCIRMITAVL